MQLKNIRGGLQNFWIQLMATETVSIRLSTVSKKNNLTGFWTLAALQTVTVGIRQFGTDSTVWDGFSQKNVQPRHQRHLCLVIVRNGRLVGRFKTSFLLQQPSGDGAASKHALMVDL